LEGMTKREQRVHAEAAALWRAMFGSAPPAKADGEALLKMITGSLPDVGYDRMASPHLRPSQISRPKSR
jgi:hypothetical protein